MKLMFSDFWWFLMNFISKYLFLEQFCQFLKGVPSFLSEAGDSNHSFSSCTHIGALKTENFSTEVPTSNGPQAGQKCSIFQNYLLSVLIEVHKCAKHPWYTFQNVYGHEDPLQNLCLLQFSWKCEGFESKYCSAQIVLVEIAGAKVLIFVLALALALATASATRNWDL